MYSTLALQIPVGNGNAHSTKETGVMWDQCPTLHQCNDVRMGIWLLDLVPEAAFAFCYKNVVPLIKSVLTSHIYLLRELCLERVQTASISV